MVVLWEMLGENLDHVERIFPNEEKAVLPMLTCMTEYPDLDEATRTQVNRVAVDGVAYRMIELRGRVLRANA